MPHLVLLYSPDLENDVDVQGLCRTLANNMLAIATTTAKPYFQQEELACLLIQQRIAK
ncbi:hypothetical protein D3C75_1184710 [compost metagenome]|uniref:5-carboxymethyl-2-hydroxymuconate isomerase n=1 Tax=Pseudomonas fluorescens TaxID=294 RepID=A0A5E7SF79_PSEFL|nr:hypothetical protein PS922_02224 [Pseudomonas fluorescens]